MAGWDSKSSMARRSLNSSWPGSWSRPARQLRCVCWTTFGFRTRRCARCSGPCAGPDLGYRAKIAEACSDHAVVSGDVSLCLYDVAALLCRRRHKRCTSRPRMKTVFGRSATPRSTGSTRRSWSVCWSTESGSRCPGAKVPGSVCGGRVRSLAACLMASGNPLKP